MKQATLAVSLAVFAAALVLPAPSVAQGGQADLAVTRLVLTGPTPAWTDGVATDTMLEVVVANLGTGIVAAYEVDFSWVGQEGPSAMNGPGNGLSEGSVLVSERPLGPGESETFTAPWHLQPGQAGAGALRAVAIIGGSADGESGPANSADSDLANNVRSVPLFIRTHAFSFGIVDAPMEVPAGGVGFFRLQVENQGNVAGRYELVLATAPGDSRLEPSIKPSVLDLPPGTRANATLFVDFDPGGDDRPFAVRYAVEARPVVGAAQRRDTPTLTGDGEDPSLEGFAFSAAATSGSLAAPSGATTPVRVLLQNTGPRPDVYTLSASLEGGEDWTIGGTRVGLYPNESGEAIVPLTVPAGVPAGTRALLHLDVSASLLANPVPVDIEVVAPGPVLSIASIGLDTAQAYVGDTPQVEVEVVNQGLDARPGAVLRLSTEVPGAMPQLVEVLLDSIPAGGRLVHQFPLDRLEAGGAARFQAGVVSPEGAASPIVPLFLTVHAPALHVDLPTAMAGGPGEDVPYRVAPNAFRVSNVGEITERVEFLAFAEAGSARIEGLPSLLLAPGETRTVAVVQGLPRPVEGRATVALTLTAQVAARPSLSWSATVETVLRDLDPPTLRQAGAPPALWTLDQPFPLDVLVEDDDRVDAVNATVTDPTGVQTVVVLSPAADGHWAGLAKLREAGEHRVRFAATDPAGNAAQPLTFTVRAANVEPPVLRLEGLGNGTVDGETALRLAIEDRLAIVAATLEIRQGSAVVRRTLDVVEGNATVDLSGIPAGPAELTFEVVDAAGASARLVAHVEVAGSRGDEDHANSVSQEAPAPAVLSVLAALALSGLVRARRREDTP